MDSALIVLVSPADAEASGTAATVAALARALGPRAVIELRTAPDPVAEAARPSPRPEATVVLHWEQDGRRAHLKVRPQPSAEWLERDLGFDAHDLVAERGRAVGLAIASMLPELPEAPPLPAASTRTHPAPPRGPRPQPAPLGEVQLRVQLGLAPGGLGGGVGGALEGQLYLGPLVGLHATFGLRGADAPAVEGTESHLRAGGGLAVRWRVARAFELGAALDLLVLRDSVGHFSIDGDDLTPVSQARALPGLRGDLRAAWFFTGNAAVGLSLGAEGAFGETAVFLERKQVTSVVPLRLLLEPGLSVRF